MLITFCWLRSSLSSSISLLTFCLVVLSEVEKEVCRFVCFIFQSVFASHMLGTFLFGAHALGFLNLVGEFTFYHHVVCLSVSVV